jgi:hypothetical protein
MKALRIGLGLWTVAILALPAAATAESLVPPENSAATQYTETIPTAGGQKDIGKAGSREKRSPAAVLGSHKARKLSGRGRQGRAAAEVAAATAPGMAVTSSPGQPSSDGGAAGGRGIKAGEEPADRASGRTATDRGVALSDVPGGSSGFGEVLAQATGSSSGQTRPLLPLLILGTILWSLAYLWRRRRHVG